MFPPLKPIPIKERLSIVFVESRARAGARGGDRRRIWRPALLAGSRGVLYMSGGRNRAGAAQAVSHRSCGDSEMRCWRVCQQPV
jgi:hypothetical protein